MRNAINAQKNAGTKQQKIYDTAANKPENNFQVLLTQVFSFFKQQFSLQNKYNETALNQILTKLNKLERY
jgi:hypothetical protein